jgi:hypothetical protein
MIVEAKINQNCSCARAFARVSNASMLLMCGAGLNAAQLARDDIQAETLKPYNGPIVHGVDTSTLSNKVMCGYQGWFNAQGDGAERGWIHWTKRRGPLAPGNAKIDLWPDVSELGADERFATGFKHADGRAAEVFSSASGCIRNVRDMHHPPLTAEWNRLFCYRMSCHFQRDLPLSLPSPRAGASKAV